MHRDPVMTFLARVGRIFPRNPRIDTVKTKVHFEASPEAVWQAMMFYEEVPQRPNPLLRLFLPRPVRTEGDKTRVGSTIACNYESGYLEKRITATDPASFVRFDVILQQLGIEDCIGMTGGSYDIRGDGRGSEVVLTTLYHGHLRPRWLWRPFEHFLAHGLHHHILNGMRVVLEADPVAREARALPTGS
jgi:hypothetical protein